MGSEPVFPKVMTPPDLDLVNVPAGERGVSSFTAELPQQAGVEADGREGKALSCWAVMLTTLVASVPATEQTSEWRDSPWLGLN